MKNEFIPTNFEIYPLEKDSPSIPTLIKASGVRARLERPSVVADRLSSAALDRPYLTLRSIRLL